LRKRHRAAPRRKKPTNRIITTLAGPWASTIGASAGTAALDRGGKGPAGQTGAVTLIQRFGSSLNLNIHFHLLVLDGVYVRSNERLEFRRIAPPTKSELGALLTTITSRVGRQHRGEAPRSRRDLGVVGRSNVS